MAISVMVPHFSSELLEQLLNKQLADCTWPSFDAELAKVTDVGIAIQVNGKLRGTIQTTRGRAQTDIVPEAEVIVAPWLTGQKIIKVIFVQDRLINFVVASE
jgi:leucyl-tRNA synthetase